MSLRPSAAPLFAAFALALASTACGAPTHRPTTPRTTSATVASGGGPAAQQSIDELLAREATTPLKDFRVRAADGAFELHVKVSAAPTVKNKKDRQGAAYSIVSFPMAGDIDVTCHAAASSLDLARWVESIIDEIHAKLTVPPTVDVEVIEGHPLLFVHADTIVDVGGVKKRLIAKFAVTHFDQGSVACVHDGIGYEETFRAVARHLVATTKTPQAERPKFRSIAISRDGDRVVGFEETRAYPGTAPGESRQMTMASAVIVRDDGWTTGDAGWFGLVDAKGVVRERSLRRLAKRTVYDVTLERKSPGVFAYEGKVEGEPKKGTFKAREPLVTRLSRAPAMAAFLHDPKRKQVGFLHFDEELPASAVREVFTHEGGDQLGLEDGGHAYHCVTDARGLCTKLWREGSSWTVQRVYVAGSL